MDMQAHILAAMREEFDRWEGILASDPRLPDLPTLGDWTTKDVVTHLWAWQQATVARLYAALHDHEPVFPKLLTEVGGDWEEETDRTNAHVYAVYHSLPWAAVHENWRNGFLHLLELGGQISEIDFLNGGRFPWLNGWSVAFIILASYDHHKEHYDKLQAWLREHAKSA